MRWVVVGGGTAGCIAAARLSDRAADEVVLLEAGPDHGAAPVPGDVGPLPPDPARLRYESVVRRPGSVPTAYPQGNGLGGSSLVNAGLVDPWLVEAGLVGGLLPAEEAWAFGPVGRALLATEPAARRALLVRAGGVRVTVADAVLRPVLDRPNLRIRTGALVRSVVVDRRRAVGVELVGGEVVAADRVVLAAGAIRTPTILLRSGVDTPGLGEGLQDHPSFTVTLALRAGLFDPSLPMIGATAVRDDHQVLALEHLPEVTGLGAITVGLLRVRSTGRVTLAGIGGDAEPSVELGQLTDPADAEALCRAVAEVAEMLDLPPWREVVAEAYVDAEGTPLASIAGSVERIASWVPSHLGGHQHVVGTCAEGVVTDTGVVRGYDGLFVCDASVLPRVPVGNPYAEVVRTAVRTASIWHDDARQGHRTT